MVRAPNPRLEAVTEEVDHMAQSLAVGVRCSTCSHPQRAEIEDALSSGTHSLRGIARQFGIGSEALRRHVHGHLSQDVQDAFRAVEGLPGLTIAQRLLAVANHARGVRHDADDRADDRLALAAGKAEHTALLGLAEQLGVRSGDAIENLEEAHAAMLALIESSRRNPEIAATVAEVLSERGQVAWAASFRKLADNYSETTKGIENG